MPPRALTHLGDFASAARDITFGGMKPLNILLYEDDDRFRDSLSQFVAASAGLNLVGAFADCRNVAQHVEILRPDVVLTDLEMPNVDGLTGMSIIKSQFPEVKVLIITHLDDDDKIFNAMLEGGADGYLLKISTPERIRESIQEVMEGGAAMSPYIAKRALQLAKEQSPSPLPWARRPAKIAFTDTEQRVLEWLTQGHSYKMIAAELDISINTVKSHLKRIYEKMQVHSAPEAVSKAIREKWV
jgi:DNA-binding NarL/FixJ family response regulator